MIGNELNTLAGTTSDIRTQIKNKGQSVPANTSLSDLPSKIDNIVNTGGEKLVYTVDEIVTGEIEEIFDKTCTYLRPNCFRNCTKLQKATFYTISKICSFAFCSCYKFHTLVLPGDYVYLDDINAFRYTLIEKGQGLIYVKDSLLSKYQNPYRDDGTKNPWFYFYNYFRPMSLYAS